MILCTIAWLISCIVAYYAILNFRLIEDSMFSEANQELGVPEAARFFVSILWYFFLPAWIIVKLVKLVKK